MGIYIEIMKYNYPKGSQKITRKKTNDMGGIRHVAFEVKDILQAFKFIEKQKGMTMINTSPQYGPPEELTPFPFYFLYCVDKYGVQWEFEQGRPIGLIKGIM